VVEQLELHLNFVAIHVAIENELVGRGARVGKTGLFISPATAKLSGGDTMADKEPGCKTQTWRNQ